MTGRAQQNGSNRPEGSALIVALAIVLLLASVSTVVVMEMSTRARNVEVDLEDIKAFEAAEAGIDAALHDINSAVVYQPKMYDAAMTRRDPNCLGQLNADGSMPAYSGYALVGPNSGKPITVHVARKASTNCDPNCSRPGCLGTSLWTAADDLDGNGRPTWSSQPLNEMDAYHHVIRDGHGNPHKLHHLSGALRYCEDHIVPQSLGNVAFFTYAVNWFHNGVDDDNDGVVDGHAERNKYTIYSTGIHRGLVQSGVTEAGKAVTIEVIVEAMDKDFEQLPHGALEVQINPRPNGL